jgi:hypothetical protein
LQETAAEFQALRMSGNSSYRAALDYFAATTSAKLAWLEQFASSLERGERDTRAPQNEAVP